ncbi:MAG: hypothetical protein HRU20_01480 [Pseudomonadales bacterium]|nr:hypothetical protein [Pseudomonadales bacterium]
MKILKKVTATSMIGLSLTFSALSLANNYPFPQAENNSFYQGIKPSATQAQLNSSVSKFYDYWKKKYLRDAQTGGYYIQGADTDGEGKGTSESHGYGMLLSVLMAGHDPEARNNFDGLFEFFDGHRSSINNELMGWFIDNQENGSGTHDSATDGDMDIAYALLLADKQWGSSGAINYQQEALNMINSGVKISLVNHSSKRLMRGDWDSDALTTRSSDWMPAHLRAFKAATGDNDWQGVIDEIYTMVAEINASSSKNTGLMPDFVKGDPARPNSRDNTGESHSGDYFYNAARTPWRLGTDYLLYGTPASKQASDKLVTWAKTQVGSSLNFSKYYSGYRLNGNVIRGSNYDSSVFIAPVLVAAAANPENQAFLDAGYQHVKSRHEDYFEDSVNLFCLLTISGNYWAPELVSTEAGGGNDDDSDDSADEDKDVVEAPAIVFSDDFESGWLNDEYWRHDGQVRVNYQAANTATGSEEGVLLKKKSSIMLSVDTSAYDSLTLSYERRSRNYDKGEFLLVEFSIDGSDWLVLEKTQDKNWMSQRFTGLPGSKDFRLRFSTNANNKREKANIDNLVISGE